MKAARQKNAIATFYLFSLQITPLVLKKTAVDSAYYCCCGCYPQQCLCVDQGITANDMPTDEKLSVFALFPLPLPNEHGSATQHSTFFFVHRQLLERVSFTGHPKRSVLSTKPKCFFGHRRHKHYRWPYLAPRPDPRDHVAFYFSRVWLANESRISSSTQP